MKYYAIRIGKNVENIIVENWDKCKQYVLGYPAIYKSFKSQKQAKEYLKFWDNEKIQVELKRKEYWYIKKKFEEIQNHFDFKIPYSILIHLIRNDYTKSDLLALIEFETNNKKISKQNSKKLIQFIQTYKKP